MANDNLYCLTRNLGNGKQEDWMIGNPGVLSHNLGVLDNCSIRLAFCNTTLYTYVC